jgi:alkanesulfonate monooxygenase SsuD/methylene tetrahydromethanopterin reductase-like flavin-dependent oxidoreductase (luciferase family)
MRFGLNFFPSFRQSDLTTAAYFDQVLRMCERADELGYHSVKAVEHYFHDYGGQTPNPIVLLSAIAARTRRLRPITGAVIPAFNHPVKLAGELAMLDNISGGRLDVGFGRAFIPKEFGTFGVRMEESRARFEEGVEVIKRTSPRSTPTTTRWCRASSARPPSRSCRTARRSSGAPKRSSTRSRWPKSHFRSRKTA